MDDQLPTPSPDPAECGPSSRLSYKFQRLRERIRQAILNGELAGKLPGERALALRFDANAKTLSKALTDLAAEGLLQRSIGRGTYVKGAVPTDAPQRRAWLLLCEPDQLQSPAVRELSRLNPDAQAMAWAETLRPSFLSKFTAAVNFAAAAPESLLRDLTLRGITLIHATPRDGSCGGSAVLLDRSLAAFHAARDLLLLNHRHLAAVASDSVVAAAMRLAAARYAPAAVVTSLDPEQLADLPACGATAVVCDGLMRAEQIRAQLTAAGLSVPQRVSLMALDIIAAPACCSGYYASESARAAALAQAIDHAQPHHPVVFWLNPVLAECGTVAMAP